MLPIVLPEDEVNELIKKAEKVKGYQLSVDLEKQEITDDFNFKTTFQIDELRRYCLLNGLDDIGLTLQYENTIAAYEQKRLILARTVSLI